MDEPAFPAAASPTASARPIRNRVDAIGMGDFNGLLTNGVALQLGKRPAAP
jgi:hypothetical protein